MMIKSSRMMKVVEPDLIKKYPELLIAISTKDGGVSPSPYFLNLGLSVGDEDKNVLDNRKRFFESLNIPLDRIVMQKQIHSDNINIVNESCFIQDSDALITNEKNLYLAISIADCIPVFLYSPDKKVIAGIHSGWKGTEYKISQKVFERMVDEYGVSPAEMIAYIGPGISVENYEVSKEVAEKFQSSSYKIENGKFYLDLKKDIYEQLLSVGLKKESIEITSYCTFRDKELFHSHRREKGATGRMFGVIGMRE
ncbi:MAG: peptidoglycan editing factor PgeF [Ignavibacteria bacterium]|nr:peptidoglycan editing factor PgeF [Ignavibacteria bacterium]